MTFQVTLTGIYTPPPPETRDLANIEVDYDGTIYQWQIYIPQGIDLSAYIAACGDKVKAEIDAKELEWVNAPKTKTIENLFDGTIEVEVQKDEIVRPDIPDYYAKRRDEYPPLSDQIGALLKGVDSTEYAEILAEVASVKAKYPKP